MISEAFDKPAETDPYGKPARAPGSKLDAGKYLPGLVLGDFSPALRLVAEIGTIGARKYTPHGWKEVPDGILRYEEAFWRHLLAHYQGELHDSDTNQLHLAHAAWNLLAVLSLADKDPNQSLEQRWTTKSKL